MNTPYILITGASSNLGIEIAKSLAVENRLILHGRDIDKLENIKKSSKQYTNIDMKLPIKKLEIIVNNITPDLFIVDNEGENYLKQLNYNCKFLNYK